MNKRFKYLKKDGSWSDVVSAAKIEAVVSLRVVKGQGPFQVSATGHDLSRELKRLEALELFTKRLYALRENERSRVYDRLDNVVMAVHRMPDFIETGGNHRIDEVYTFVHDKFDNASDLGICVCKQTVPGVWSQHAFCNAADFGTKEGGMAALLKMAKAVVDEAEAGRLEVEHVIVGNQIWTRGIGWHDYTGQYHYHVHVDCTPNYSGVPACAQ